VDAARAVSAATRLAHGEELGLSPDTTVVALLIVVDLGVGAAPDLVELGWVGAVGVGAGSVAWVAAGYKIRPGRPRRRRIIAARKQVMRKHSHQIFNVRVPVTIGIATGSSTIRLKENQQIFDINDSIGIEIVTAASVDRLQLTVALILRCRRGNARDGSKTE
jgi:hypothetical protein